VGSPSSACDERRGWDGKGEGEGEGEESEKEEVQREDLDENEAGENWESQWGPEGSGEEEVRTRRFGGDLLRPD
jgi:hypothetical protein